MCRAIYVFPAKPSDKEYQYKKDPRKVLEITDMEVVLAGRNNRGVYNWIHWPDDYDKLDDKEIVKKYNEICKTNLELSSRRSGQGYTSGDKESLVRILTVKRDWMKQAMGL